MADRLFIGVLGHRHTGKTTTWNTLFGDTVRTGTHPRWLQVGQHECVEVFLISGSNEERRKYAHKVLKNQDARIVLCSMQYVEAVHRRTLDYVFGEGFRMYVQWLNPGHDEGSYPDYLGIGNLLLYNKATLAVRSGQVKPDRRVREIREFIYGWTSSRRLIVSC